MKVASPYRTTKNVFLLATLCVASLAVSAAPAFAGSKRNVPCRQGVIADKLTGTFRLLSSTTNDGRYRCYKNSTDAKKDKFLSTSQITTLNLEDWYRVRLTNVKSTCPLLKAETGPVVFAQVLQKNNAVFADFCPSLGRMTGSKTSDGFSVSVTETLNEASPALDCSDGVVEKTSRFELTPVVVGNHAFVGRYSVTRRCTKAGEEDKVCVVDYSGEAFRETHPIWPDVAASAAQMGGGCGIALQTCQQCHPGLTFP